MAILQIMQVLKHILYIVDFIKFCVFLFIGDALGKGISEVFLEKDRAFEEFRGFEHALELVAQVLGENEADEPKGGYHSNGNHDSPRKDPDDIEALDEFVFHFEVDLVHGIDDEQVQGHHDDKGYL